MNPYVLLTKLGREKREKPKFGTVTRIEKCRIFDTPHSEISLHTCVCLEMFTRMIEIESTISRGLFRGAPQQCAEDRNH